MKMNPLNNPTKRTARHARSARSRGAVIVLALLGAFLMAGMIGYVFNTGRHAQLRQQTQHSADATAISGAGYVARSFNTVAMNNVEISRLIAVVQMLDAVPLSIEYTLLDVRATAERVEEQLSNGGAATPEGTQQLREIAEDLREQERQLVEMDQLFNQSGYDVREMTFYDSEFGRGELWKAMESLDAISLATMEQIQDLTQVTAVETGQRNMHGGGSAFSAVAPFESGIIWKRYEFDDFRNPVVRGRLPNWVDDTVTNRGPYDTIFGWRRNRRESIEIPNPNYQPQQTSTDRFGSTWSGGTGRGGRPTIRVGSTLTGYTTYGTWQWLGDIIRSRIDAPQVLYNSQFVTRVNRMGGNKLNDLWPNSAREWVFLDPQWITSFEQAESIIDAGTPRVAYTQFVRMDFEQYFVDGVPRGPETMTDWHIIRPRRGWTTVPGATKIKNHVWEDEAETTWIQTRIEIDANGNQREVEEEHRITYRREFVWAGINVGPVIEIRNPNPTSRSDELPAPIDFDHTAMERPVDGAIGYPGSPFTFLGIAKQPNQAPMLTSLYRTSAYDGHVGLAQAAVFNNHSWDLWTQMWHAQLEPINDYDGWVSLIQSQIGNASGNDDLSTGELENLTEYLDSLRDLAPILLHH